MKKPILPSKPLEPIKPEKEYWENKEISISVYSGCSLGEIVQQAGFEDIEDLIADLKQALA